MKGIVFTELIEMMENQIGVEKTQEVIDQANLKSGGSYTSVGTYDHSEALSIVSQLSKLSGIGMEVLVKAFGGHLHKVFTKKFPQFYLNKNTFEFLKTLDSYVHQEVRKLYPDAELPKFEHHQVSEDELHMIYTSTRPFSKLAEGLLLATIDHFKEKIELQFIDKSEGKGNAALFILKRLK